MKKVLLITQEHSDYASASIRLEALKKHFQEKFTCKIIDGSYIRRIYNKKFPRNLIKIFNKFVSTLTFFDFKILFHIKYKNLIKEELNRENYDAVVITTLPHSAYMFAKTVKKFDDDIKVIIDQTDPLTFALGSNERWFHKIKIDFFFEKYFLKYVDALVVLNRKLKKIYTNNFDMNSEKVYIIEQGFKEEYICDKNKKRKVEKENFTLVYGGKFYKKLRDPKILFSVIGKYKDDLNLEIYGDIPNKYRPKNEIENVKFQGKVSQEKLFEKYCFADAILFYDNFQGHQVPGKTTEVLAFDKPLLFIYQNEDSPTLEYIQDNPKVILTKNKVPSIRNSIEYLINNIETLKDTKDQKTRYLEYTWENLMETYKNEIITS